MVKLKLTLKKRIIQVLKDADDVLTADQMLELLRDSGLSDQYIPRNTNSLGQILKSVRGVRKDNQINRSTQGNSYVSGAYYLEDEEAFNKWLSSKTVKTK